MATIVALIDDRQAIRAGVRQMLRSYFDIQVHEITERFPVALDIIFSLSPDVVLLGEVDHSQDLGIIQQMNARQQMTGSRLLLMRDVKTRSEVAQIMAAGVHGYLPSDANEWQLASAVVTVAGGGQVMLPALGKYPLAQTEIAPEAAGLTEREFSVLSALGRGLSNSEIAKELAISEATVKKHLSSVMQKVGQRDRLRAGLYAYRHGLDQAILPTSNRDGPMNG